MKVFSGKEPGVFMVFLFLMQQTASHTTSYHIVLLKNLLAELFTSSAGACG
jgi:hypothetical protein